MMTKEEYINELSGYLNRIPKEEADSALEYYREYLEEAYENGGEENLSRAISELGDPKKLASRISGDYAIKNFDENSQNMNMKEKASNVWLLILAIFASPIILPVAFAMFIVILSLTFAGSVVILTLGISAFAVVVAGVASFVMGFVVIIANFQTSLLMFGTGLFMIGFGWLMMILVVKISALFCRLIAFLAGKILKNKAV